jgi:hypothetical protein
LTVLRPPKVCVMRARDDDDDDEDDVILASEANPW